MRSAPAGAVHPSRPRKGVWPPSAQAAAVSKRPSGGAKTWRPSARNDRLRAHAPCPFERETRIYPWVKEGQNLVRFNFESFYRLPSIIR